VLIFVGDLLMGANQLAASRRGVSVDPVSVGDLFIGAIFPGLSLVALYIIYILGLAIFRPKSCPALIMTAEERASLGRRFLRALVPPLLLIIAVLGSILTGFATPTEAASIGALGAMILAAFNRSLNLRMLIEVMRNTAVISALVFGIVLGVSVFSLVFRGLGGEHLVEQVLTNVPGGLTGAIIAVMAVMFVLGFFMDTLEIILITVPITAPTIIFLGADPVWLGVMIGVNLQTSFLTPPVGFALFYMRGVAPRSITTGQIYRGIIPFVVLQLIGLGMLWAYPGLATWLPKVVFPDAVAAISESTPGSPGQTGSALEQLLNLPVNRPAQPSQGSDPTLDRLLGGGTNH
jgi:tripartite ATP-independent transporter DctM subunit